MSAADTPGFALVTGTALWHIAAMRRIGIDLGGTKIEGCVLDDADGRVLRRQRVPTEQERGYDHIVETIAGLVEALAGDATGGVAVGVGTPGAVSARTGLMKNSNTTCLNGRDLPADLARRLGRPVRVENDANCFALAEACRGAGRGGRLVFGVILGTGCGGGLVIDGRLWSGPQHIAGEWGHHVIDPAGPPCYCGQRGCVEAFIAGPAVERHHRQLGGAALDMEGIVAAARAGDATARAAFDSFIAHFGRALANLITMLDPDVIVLGGGLSNIEELYSEGRAAVARVLFNDELRTPICRHQLGDSAGVIGAALLAPGG